MWLARLGESDFSKSRLIPFTHFVPSTQPKMRLVRVRESDDSGGHQALLSNVVPHSRLQMRLCRRREGDHSRSQLALQIHFGLLPAEIGTLATSRKRCFRAFRIIFSILGGRNAAWRRSTKRCFKLSTSLRNHFLPSTQTKMQLGRGQGSYV